MDVGSQNQTAISIYLPHYIRHWPVESRFIIGIILDALLGVNFAKHHKEVMAFITLNEASWTNEGLYVCAWIATFWTGEDAVAGPFFAAWWCTWEERDD